MLLLMINVSFTLNVTISLGLQQLNVNFMLDVTILLGLSFSLQGLALF